MEHTAVTTFSVGGIEKWDNEEEVDTNCDVIFKNVMSHY